MDFATIADHLDGIPYIQPNRARMLYDFILEQKPAQCLELGFAHGTSSCYIAAALGEIGTGHLTAVDLSLDQVDFDPSLEALLERTGLARYVTIARETNSYTWFLKKQIEAQSTGANCEPLYDFCFIDGAKNWTIDGLAFFLVDKLLKENGWLLFDDFNWTYHDWAIKEGRTEVDGVTVRNLGEDELREAHIERIFHLLVMQHPDYSDFKIQDDIWGWARKSKSPHKTLKIEETYSLGDMITRGLRRFGRKIL